MSVHFNADAPESYRVVTDATAVDLDFIYAILKTSYWAGDRPREIVEASWRSPASIPFVAFLGDEPVGIARVVTDRATFAWVCDVIVLPDHRGGGVGKLLMRAIVDHPDLQGAVRMMLRTKDAHGMYEQFGFDRQEAMWRKAKPL